MPAKELHLIGNSHIDPVWLWRLHQGKSSILNTAHSVVKIMEERKEIKFTCSSAWFHRWMEEADPALFRKIVKLSDENRWEVTGGWEVESDAVIAGAEPLLRQAESGRKYFREKFGKEVTTAYCPDSFGHAAGLPEILSKTGFTHYVIGRAGRGAPGLFRWKSASGAEVKVLRILENYGVAAAVSREEFRKRIEKIRGEGDELQTLFIGVGDHGGGLYRTHFNWIDEWKQEFNIHFSTLEEYFRDADFLFRETVTGELGPCFPGCYANNHEVKRKVARAANLLLKAERLDAKESDLAPAWRQLLFAHFHDSLPGTSVKRAYRDDIFPLLGFAEHIASDRIDLAMSRISSAADTSFLTEGGVHIHNFRPEKSFAVTAFDGFTDPNGKGVPFQALSAKDGTLHPLQFLPPDTTFGPFLDGWGKFTAAVPVPPLGDAYYAFVRTDREFPPTGFARQRELLARLSLPVFFDNERTWGFRLESYQEPVGRMAPVSAEELADGPVCSVLRAEFRYGESSVRLDLCKYRELPEIRIAVRLDWREPRSCLKLALAIPDSRGGRFLTGGAADVTERLAIPRNPPKVWVSGREKPFFPNSGERAMIDWCGIEDGTEERNTSGFLTSDLHGCDCADGSVRLTLVRPVLYADHAPMPQPEESGWMDLGVSEREIWYFEGVPAEEAPILADRRLLEPETREITGHLPGDGTDSPEGFELRAEHTVMTSLRRDSSGGRILTLINYGGAEEVRLGKDVFSVPEKGIVFRKL